MKKFVLVILGLMICKSGLCDTITVSNFSADSGVSHLNHFKDTVIEEFNGNIEGSGTNGSSKNIKADSLGELDMADEINPRVRANELLNIGSDSVSAGVLTQTAVVESGCVPADDTDLISDVSACVAYVNGYRVSKAATSNTYTASRDCYVDLSQAGVYTTSCVTNGAAQPSVAANSVRLAKVVTDGTEITSVTSLYTTRVPGLLVPSHYRSGLLISRDSATTIAILPGTAEINNSMVSKTATTTLTISTAGDWAGGSSLQGANTSGYVGIDTSGNLKLHTTAPTHDNYAVSTTAGKKRYATWSSTVYRILGWFRMNGASQISPSDLGNIKEGDVSNTVISSDVTSFSLGTSTTATTSEINYYSSGGQITLVGVISGDVGGTWDGLEMSFVMDGTAVSNCQRSGGMAGIANFMLNNSCMHTPSQAAHTYRISSKNIDSGDAANLRGRTFIIRED